MRSSSTSLTQHNPNRWSLAVVALLLLAIIVVLFHRSFGRSEILFSNDGPLGAISVRWGNLPSAFFGAWQDLNSLGGPTSGTPPDLSIGLKMGLGNLLFAKFYAPIALLILGLSAWFCFSQMKLGRWASLLGGLAAMLSSGFFSTACWGVASTVISYAMNFCALGLALNPSPRHRIARLVLAGFCVGMGVMEGFDVGAIFSVVTAMAVVYSSLIGDGSVMKRTALGFGRVVTIAVCAAIIAASTVSALVGTQIKGVAGMQMDTRSKAERWNFATTWSFPPQETVSLLVPGIFGFRTVPPPHDGSDYWGRIGGDPSLDQWFDNGRQGPPSSTSFRFSGGGSYEGVIVLLLAIWAAMQAFRGQNSVFSDKQRKFLWFWIALGTVSLLFAYGRFAPFYRLVYSLPYFSTIRNPVKFISVFNFSLLMLFAFGVHGLFRRYMEKTAVVNSTDFLARFKSWRAKASSFDKWWLLACLAAIVLSFIGWGIYASYRPSLEQYLDTVGFGGSWSSEIANFSVAQVGWFILFLLVSVGLLTLIFTGVFSGRRATTGAVLLGLVLVADLAHADVPWIYYWDYKQKYESNPVIDFLREKPYEHRVAILPFSFPSDFALFSNLYNIEWKQQHFQYYNIQSLDIVQMPRTPQDIAAFQGVMADSTKRKWELTNTRYLLGPAPYLDALNSQFDPQQKRFRIVMRFELEPKPGVTSEQVNEDLQHGNFASLTAVPNQNGRYALFEFTGALPRAKLYTHWAVATNNAAELSKWVKTVQTPLIQAGLAEWANALPNLSPDDQATLKELVSDSFNPAQTVLLANPLSLSTNQMGTGTNTSSVEFESYAPKDVKLKTKSDDSTVLLLNDKYDPNWNVSVDGNRAELLRCNFIMRGVALSPGEHTVEFVFKPDIKTLYISLAAIAIALSLVGYLGFSRKRDGSGGTESERVPDSVQKASGKNSRPGRK